MSTPTMNFDPTLQTHAGTGVTSGALAGGPAVPTAAIDGSGPGAGTALGTSPGTGTTGSGTAGSGTAGGAAKPTAGTGALATFEGFLKTAGHVAGVVLSEIVKYVVPMAQVVEVADPAAVPALTAFTTSLQLVQAAVVSAQQRWAGEGSAANTEKLADVLVTVEQPIILLFAQVGLSVDTAYVTNLVNGVVAILNAQPGVVLQPVTK